MFPARVNTLMLSEDVFRYFLGPLFAASHRFGIISLGLIDITFIPRYLDLYSRIAIALEDTNNNIFISWLQDILEHSFIDDACQNCGL